MHTLSSLLPLSTSYFRSTLRVLELLDLSGNTKFAGSLPDQYSTMTSLRGFNMSGASGLAGEPDLAVTMIYTLLYAPRCQLLL